MVSVYPRIIRILWSNDIVGTNLMIAINITKMYISVFNRGNNINNRDSNLPPEGLRRSFVAKGITRQERIFSP